MQRAGCESFHRGEETAENKNAAIKYARNAVIKMSIKLDAKVAVWVVFLIFPSGVVLIKTLRNILQQ